MIKPGQRPGIREKFFRRLFLAGDAYKIFVTWLNGFCRFFFTVTLFLFVPAFVYYIGFSVPPETSEGLETAFKISFLVLFLSKYIPETLNFKKGKSITLIFRIIVFLYTLGVLISNFTAAEDSKAFWKPFYGNTQVIVAIFLIGISELSGLIRLVSTAKIPPALVFSFSFILIIVMGSGLLILPNAHNGQLTYIDSLFTAVSAVCVTGLVVVNTSSAFTTLGQIIILCLIQIGGLGIMTFTGFFSYIFSSGSSFRDKLLLKRDLFFGITE